nr:hypothetical protein GCM10020092_006790 [Actinoplanes digitatis]
MSASWPLRDSLSSAAPVRCAYGSSGQVDRMEIATWAASANLRSSASAMARTTSGPTVPGAAATARSAAASASADCSAITCTRARVLSSAGSSGAADRPAAISPTASS